MSYKRLRDEGPGIHWPSNDEHPDGTECLYTEGDSWAEPDVCETYGKDPLTGALLEETEYRSLNPLGKAIIMAADYVPPFENPSEEYPFLLTTGRTI